MFGTVSPTRKIFADKAELLHLRLDEGLSLSQIAKHYHVCVATVHNWLRAFGIRCTEEERIAKITGVKPWNYRGEKDSNGYAYVFSPDHPCKGKDGYVPEHRLSVERAIGRILYPAERVHHLSHIRRDNAVLNLLLLPNAKTHTLFHHWVDRAGAYALGHSDVPPGPFFCGAPMLYRGVWVETIQCEFIEQRSMKAG